MKNYVLVHGAWEGAWSWNETRPGLERRGHKLTIVDLPGSAGNPLPVSQVTMDGYVRSVIDTIAELDGPVVLVGHSMAGAVISNVAERIPEQIERLVYVAGFLLKSGDSVLEAMQRDPGGEFLPGLDFAEDMSSATASADLWRDKAFHDVDADRVERVLPLVDGVKQSTEPFSAQIAVTVARFGSVPKTYVRTSLDKMVSPQLQTEMVANWTVDRDHTLVSGHFPTLSVPEELAELIG